MKRLAAFNLAVCLAAGGVQAQSRLAIDHCRAVAVAMGHVFEALPPETLSIPFRQTATGFVKSSINCSSRHRIEVMSEADARALDDVAAMLRARSPTVDLKAALDIVDQRRR
jgi:hypothetical protein